MKINETITKKRKELGLTQEQVAEYLNISTPAVNKWEKGNSYPDITLLPALARLLKTDLNNLLSFNEDLSDVEIYNFANSLDPLVKEQGYEKAFEIAMDKISQYPTCEKLIAAVVPYLNGALHIYGVSEYEKYMEQIETLYKRLSKSEVQQIRELAVSMLIVRSMEQKNYELAEDLINSISTTTINKNSQLATLYTKQGKNLEAAKLWQQQLLAASADIQISLMCLTDFAIKDSDIKKAEFLAELYYNFTKEFSPVSWTAYTARLELSTKLKDIDTCLKILKEYLPIIKENPALSNNILYDKISSDFSTATTETLLIPILRELKTSNEYEFIRGNKEFEDLINEL